MIAFGDDRELRSVVSVCAPEHSPYWCYHRDSDGRLTPLLHGEVARRQDQPPLGVGESASVPSAAAIANAIFDATGVRLRQVPFTAERLKAGMAERTLGTK